MDWAHCIGTGVGSGSRCCMLTVLQSTRRLPLLALSNTSCKRIFDIVDPHFSVKYIVRKLSTLYTASTMALLGNIVTTFSDPAATLENTIQARIKKSHKPPQGHLRHEPPSQRCQTLPQKSRHRLIQHVPRQIYHALILKVEKRFDPKALPLSQDSLPYPCPCYPGQ